MSVYITENFESNLESIRSYLAENQNSRAFHKLIQKISDVIITNLESFPEMGVDLLAKHPRSVAAQLQLESVMKYIDSMDLREYIFDDFILLYASDRNHVYLLAIREHRQLSYDFMSRWLD